LRLFVDAEPALGMKQSARDTYGAKRRLEWREIFERSTKVILSIGCTCRIDRGIFGSERTCG
jgi:hypothetical protein